MTNTLLVDKYNAPVPRYTSYPTVPNWKSVSNTDRWMSVFSERFHGENSRDGISVYIHLPFCESLCTYCGCNKKITTNHSVEAVYTAALEKEWKLYRSMMHEAPVIRELHLGGGTPTFFAPEMLKQIVSTILNGSVLHPEYTFSIEGHPNNTTMTHLEVLARLGFRRVSYGVQDNDPDVQRIINRIQPLQNVENATRNARTAGFTSVNFDLIYGLPLQSPESITRTMNDVLPLRPDRIAFYSYAHVPWTSRAQRLFDESHLPDAATKLEIYEAGRKLLLQAGYREVGMDHFALPGDELFTSLEKGQLHRNFMGYTTQHTELILGLGVSAISDTGNAFAQNHKTLHDYYAAIERGECAVTRGYFLDDTDIAIRRYITEISCNGFTGFDERDLCMLREKCFEKLQDLAGDGLIEWDESGLRVTDTGRRFTRNICSAFDLYLKPSESPGVFSKAI